MQARRVLIVGGGTMGRGIAGLCALCGFDTAIFEQDREARGRLRDSIESSWRRASARGKLPAERVETASGRLRILERLEEETGADLAIEAVPESLALKESVFESLDRLCPPEAVLASNTSSLSIAELARATRRPDRVVGIHFFNPVAAMPLVEVVSGPSPSRGGLESRPSASPTLRGSPPRGWGWRWVSKPCAWSRKASRAREISTARWNSATATAWVL
jgi:3-hydroxybutyryl-CoA dehydrogenase